MSERKYPVYERKLPPHTREDLVHYKDEYDRDHFTLKDGRAVCGRLKREHNRAVPEEVCLAPPMKNGACKVHGGKSGRKISSGRYARALSTWKPAFERALQDKDLLDTRRDLALMDVTIEKLLARIEELDTPGWRAELAETYEHLKAAMRSKRQAGMGEGLKRLGELIDHGAGLDQLASDLMTYVDKRAARANKADELALRREEKITVSEVAAIFAQWLQVLEKRLDQRMYLEVVEDLRLITDSQRIPIGQPEDEDEDPDEVGDDEPGENGEAEA